MKVLCTPGHSIGSLSVRVDREAAIVGDSLFNILGLVALIDSWRRLLATGCRLLYPAHGQPVSSQRLRELLRRKTSA